MQIEDRIIPLEAKAEENLRAKRLSIFYQKYSCPICVRTSVSDYRKQDWILNIPLYEIFCLRILKKKHLVKKKAVRKFLTANTFA